MIIGKASKYYRVALQITHAVMSVVYQQVDYNDDQSEPLCICLATMILFYLTDI